MTYNPLDETTVNHQSGLVGYQAWMANRDIPDEVYENITGSVSKTQTASGLEYSLPGTDGEYATWSSQQPNDWIGGIGMTVTYQFVGAINPNLNDYTGVGFGVPAQNSLTTDRNYYVHVQNGEIYSNGVVEDTFSAPNTDTFFVLELTVDMTGKYDFGARTRGETINSGGTFEYTSSATPNNPTSVGWRHEDNGNGSNLRVLFSRQIVELDQHIL